MRGKGEGNDAGGENRGRRCDGRAPLKESHLKGVTLLLFGHKARFEILKLTLGHSSLLMDEEKEIRSSSLLMSGNTIKLREISNCIACVMTQDPWYSTKREGWAV